MTAEEIARKADGPDSTWRTTLEFPGWVVRALDAEVERVGGTRETVVETWVSQRASIPQGNLRRGAARGSRDRTRD